MVEISLVLYCKLLKGKWRAGLRKCKKNWTFTTAFSLLASFMHKN